MSSSRHKRLIGPGTAGAATIMAAALAMSSASAAAPCGATSVRANCQVPGSPPTGRYAGSDAVGKVRFVLVASRGTLTIRGFHFANKCAGAGTTIVRTLRVGPRDRFRLTAGEITISGSVYRAFVGDFFMHSPLGPGIGGYAQGTVRVHAAACDSGTLRFTATWKGS